MNLGNQENKTKQNKNPFRLIEIFFLLRSLNFRISVMHDPGGMFGSVFLGEVKISLENDLIDLNSGHKAW